MIYFKCDYMAGAHLEILASLCDTNLIKSVGYGFDSFTAEAKSTILNMPLFIDGARLAYGLAAENADVSLHDIAALADVFYIGGTKCGAL